MKNKKNRAFLKWAGGKFGLIENIKERLPQASQLIEPFVGAASVFLNTDYDRYLLNDINPDLISLYKNLKQYPDKLIAETERLFIPHNNQENQYYSLREDFNACTNKMERSALFIYLNRHGYNGLCRYSSKGRFNVPFGRYKKPYFPADEMLYFSSKAKKASFTCQTFEKTFKKVSSDSVVYCDPPYIPINATSSFTSYSKHGFSALAQKQLAKLATSTAQLKKVPVLVSNHDLPITRDLYKEAAITSFDAKRSISQNGQNRKPVKEVLALFTPL